MSDTNTALLDAAAGEDVEQLRAALAVFPHLIDEGDVAQGRTPMHVAARNGRATSIKLLFASGSKSLDAIDRSSFTPLHHAAELGHASAVEMLFQLGAQFKPIRYACRTTPFHAVAQNGHLEVLRTLIRFAHTSIDCEDTNRRKPMHTAAEHGHTAAVALLHEAGSLALHAGDRFGFTPMHQAALHGQVGTIEAIARLDHGTVDAATGYCLMDHFNYSSFFWKIALPGASELDRRLICKGQTPLLLAAWNGQTAAVETLVRLGSKAIDTPDAKGTTPMLGAAINGHVDTIEALVRLGSRTLLLSKKEIWNEALVAVAWRGDVGAIEKCVQLGCRNVNRTKTMTTTMQKGTPLFTAIRAGHVRMVETLLRYGNRQEAVDAVDWRDRTPIFEAALFGRAEIIEVLMRSGCRTMDTKVNGETPMHMAARVGSVAVIEELVRLGSRAIDTLDKQGQTPLHLAAKMCHVETIRTLLRLGSRGNAVLDKLGCSPLHIAAFNGDVKSIEALLLTTCQVADAHQDRPEAASTSAQPNCRVVDLPSHHGWAPMHEAAKKGHVAAIEALVRLGSRAIDALSISGQTPLCVAAKSGRDAAVETLVRLGSQALDIPDRSGKLPMDYILAGQKRRGNCLKILRMLGARSTIPDKKIAPPRLKQLSEPLDEQEVLQLRFRLYFALSLVPRLLQFENSV